MLNEKKAKNIAQNIVYALDQIWRSKNGKMIVLMKVITIIFNALSPIVMVIIPGMIINELTNEQRMPTLVFYVGILVVTPMLIALFNWLIKFVFTRYIDAFVTSTEIQFYKHLTRVDYQTFENPDTVGLAWRSLFAFSGLHDVLNTVTNIISAILSIVAITVVIAMLNVPIIALILGIIIINTFINSFANKKVHSYRHEENLARIKQHRYNNHLWVKDYAKEIRLFNLVDFLTDLYGHSAITYNKLQFKLSMIRERPNLFRTATSMFQSTIVYAFLIYSVISNGLGIGYVAIFISATSQFSSTFENIAKAFLSFQQKSYGLREAHEFLNTPLTQYDSGDLTPVFNKNSEIRFENVSFKYPGSENYALKNVNITMHGDERVCVVGHNGSGKSTFVKLLSRLYSPTEGAIYLNGKNIVEYKYTEYQQLFSAVFQETKLFDIVTLGQNISLSPDFDRIRMDEVCEMCGLTEFVLKLPKGYDTFMDKHIDPKGIEPSGGETQRIMMARAVYHNAPMYILDEPTAAMDPLIEYEIYTQFSNMINDSAAVLITHRLSAVKLVDKVAVFEEGKLIEYGTHDELFANRGAYHEMYEKQAHFYIK